MLRRLLLLVWLLGLALPLQAHDGLDVEPPTSEAEAWNTLTLCGANISSLIASKQWAEIPQQATIANQALRFLRERAMEEHPETVLACYEAEAQVLQLFRVASRQDAQRTPREAATFAGLLDGLAEKYPTGVTHALVYSCPMCRGVRELEATKRCPKCGMALVPRIIPASSAYNTPGEPSITLTPTLDHPLQPGKTSQVRLRLTRKTDGAPVALSDLLVVHTEPIHLLIIDSSLTDYHHLHPQADPAKPGEYLCALTPLKPGPYRVFADLVPALSNVQEYARCDLPAPPEGEPVQPAANKTTAEVDGLRYDLQWETGEEVIRAQQPVKGTIRLMDLLSKLPFDRLEPIMGTYAHVVAFHEDRQTVLHMHPLGAAPQKPEDRGGPSFTFQFYAPKPGLYRLYSQVQVGGASHFAPFVVNVRE